MTAWTIIAGLATLVGGVAGVWYLRESYRSRKHPKRSLGDAATLEAELRGKTGPRVFEILPFNFEVMLGPGVPYVEVTLYTVNHYRRRKVTVDRLEVTRLGRIGGQVLDNIPRHGPRVSVHPRNSQLVYCRKDLPDSLARELAKVPTRKWLSCSVSAEAEVTGRWWNRKTRVGIHAHEIVGHVSGSPKS